MYTVGHVILSVLCTRLTVQAVSACLCQVGTFFHHPLPMSIATECHMYYVEYIRYSTFCEVPISSPHLLFSF